MNGIKYCKQSLCEQFKIEQFKIAGAAGNNSKLKTQNSKFALRNIVHTVKKCYKQNKPYLYEVLRVQEHAWKSRADIHFFGRITKQTLHFFGRMQLNTKPYPLPLKPYPLPLPSREGSDMQSGYPLHSAPSCGMFYLQLGCVQIHTGCCGAASV